MRTNHSRCIYATLAKVWLAFLLVFIAGCIPVAAQLPGAPEDPLARIREAAKGNVTACSATGETLCEQVAPKIVANAQGESPLQENIRHLIELTAGSTDEAASDAKAVAWATGAFRQAGVDVHTEIGSDTRPAGTTHKSESVVAEIRGREKPDEWVLLGAHLTSSSDGNEPITDACNAAMVIEAARDIQRTGIRPRRSIRFVLFGGEQKGMAGSWAYIQQHQTELDRAEMAVLITAGAKRITGYALDGRHEIESGVREALKPIDSMGISHFSLDAPFEIDSLDFLLEGIPTIVSSAGNENNVNDSGASENSLARFNEVDIKELKRNTAIAAVTAFGLAERASPLGRRQTHGEVETLLKATGLDKPMKKQGLWPLWEAGLRGRHN